MSNLLPSTQRSRRQQLGWLGWVSSADAPPQGVARPEQFKAFSRLCLREDEALEALEKVCVCVGGGGGGALTSIR